MKQNVDGDRNTCYFYIMAKIKNTSKAIFSLQVLENILTDSSFIDDHITSHFETFFTSNNVLERDSLLVGEVIHTHYSV